MKRLEARDMVEAATGQRPVGYNCNWLRRGPNTLSLLQELGYLYHIDDVSRDEPFIEQVNGKDFVVVPYTLRNNDIVLIEGRNYSPAKFLEQIKLDFDQLYEEAGHRSCRPPRGRSHGSRTPRSARWRSSREHPSGHFRSRSRRGSGSPTS